MEHNYVAEPAAASTEFFANGDTSMLKQSLRRIHQPWSSMVLCLDSSTVVVLLSSILVHNGGTGHGRRCSREGAGERLEIQLVLWSCAQMLGTLKAHSLMSWMFAEAQPKLVREHILNIVCLYWDISYIHIYIYYIYIADGIIVRVMGWMTIPHIQCFFHSLYFTNVWPLLFGSFLIGASGPQLKL